MAKKRTLIFPKRGEIYQVHFDPTQGSEISKTRPALILQNDTSNEYSPVTIVAAITSKYDDRLYPTEVLIYASESSLSVDSVVALNQIWTVDKQRLVRRLGAIHFETMAQVERAILISLGITEV